VTSLGGRGRRPNRLRIAAVAALVVVACVAVSAPPQASAKAECWERLVADWQDGQIGNVYPISCYRDALQRMPEDVRLYSSAASDIRRALAARVLTARTAAGSASASAASVLSVERGDPGLPWVPFAIAGSLAAAIALLAGGSLAIRRRTTRDSGPD
jgi:hypothetical protein